MTAAELQRLHGDLLATAAYVDLSPYRLVKALAERGIIITEPVARMWASKYRTPVGAERMESADELEERYGPDARQLLGCSRQLLSGHLRARWRSFVCSRQGTAGPGAAGFRYASGRLRPACGVIPYSFS